MQLNQIEMYLVDMECKILEEFENNVATAFIDADFEVALMKINISAQRGYIDAEDYIRLIHQLRYCKKLWKKLNDVK